MGMDELFKSRINISGFVLSLLKYSSSLAIVTILLIMHLCMYFFHPQWKENLVFSIYLSCIIGFIILVGVGHLFSNDLFGYVQWTHPIFFVIWSIAQIALLAFFYYLILLKLPKRFWVFMALWCIFLLWMLKIANLFMEERSALYLNLTIFTLFNLIVFIESLFTIIKGLREKREGIAIISIGSIILLSGAFYMMVSMYSEIFAWADFVAFFHHFYVKNTFLGFTVLLFLICISISISYRFARSFCGLQNLNLELEDRVEHRTQELNTMNVELQEVNAQLIELDRMKTQFVSQASHDLRTPLTAIKGSLDNLLMGIAGALSEKQAKVMTRATTSVDRLTNLINDVLDLNRIETGRIILEKSDIPFKALVENIINENHPAAELKQITLNANLGDEINLHIDGSKIERVVGELISNAIKYTPDNGNVDVCLSHEDTTASLSVKDSGIGMTAEECGKIWERFYRTSASQKFAKGSGLGLSIAKELVELHGGTLGVESKQGEGTTFTLIL
jgi:signal transduction histidine kinase